MNTINFSYQNRGGINNVYAIPPEAVKYCRLNPRTGKYNLKLWSTRPFDAVVVNIPVIASGYKWDEEHMYDDKGHYYDVSVSGKIPRCDASNRTIISDLERGKWCVLAVDNNGELKFAGDADHPLYFSSSSTTGESPAVFNGCNFIIEGQIPFKSVYIEDFEFGDL